MLTAMTDTKPVTLDELQKGDRGWFTIKPAVTIVALCWDRYSNHRCVECRLRALPNAEGKYGCAQHPSAKTKEIYCLRILLRQDDLNMWVTAFAYVAKLIMGVSVEEFHAFDDAGRKRSCRNRLLLMSADVPISVQYLTSRCRSTLVTIFP